MKIRPVGAQLFHTDGRADMTKVIVAVRYFAKGLKNLNYSDYCLQVVRTKRGSFTLEKFPFTYEVLENNFSTLKKHIFITFLILINNLIFTI